MTQPTDEEKRELAARFPMPKREDYEDDLEGYEEAVAGVKRRWQQALQFSQQPPVPSTALSPPSSPVPPPVKMLLVPGQEAGSLENVVKIFEAIQGRAATPEELAAYIAARKAKGKDRGSNWTQPTPDEQLALEARFPMPDRSTFEDDESYLEAVDGQHRARRLAAPVKRRGGPLPDSPPPSPFRR